EDAERDRAARAAVQARAAPDVAPGGAGDVLLERLGEGRGAAEATVDVLVAEHLAADALAVLRTRRRRWHTVLAGGCRGHSRRRWAARRGSRGRRRRGSRGRGRRRGARSRRGSRAGSGPGAAVR